VAEEVMLKLQWFLFISFAAEKLVVGMTVPYK
jgi:hypothetical protein